MKKPITLHRPVAMFERSFVKSGRAYPTPSKTRLILAVSSHVSSRIYFPPHVFSFDKEAYFSTPSENTADAVYQNVMRFLEKTLDEAAFQ